mgnify:CR=1 FL=1
MTGEQLRAARAMLQLDQTQVAQRSGVSVETIKRLERMSGNLRANYETIQKILDFFEASGIEFLEYGEAAQSGGPGVRLTLSQVEKIETTAIFIIDSYLQYALSEIIPDIKRTDDEIGDLLSVIDKMTDFIISSRDAMKLDAKLHYNNELLPARDGKLISATLKK